MKTQAKKHLFGGIVIAAVVLLPLAYSLFYLGAFWDPYSRLQDLPVAVVNEDQGASINGETRNVGQEVVDKLKDSDELGWVFTDARDAEDGVKGEKYYAEIVIPSDFSATLATASTAEKRVAALTCTANEKRNFLAAQILNRAVVELEEQVRAEVNGDLTLQLTEKLREVPDSLQALDDGLGQLADGSGALESGLDQAAAGQRALETGATALNGGLAKLNSGASSLNGGILALHDGLSQSLTGARTMQSKLGTALPALNDGVTRLNTGAGNLALGLNGAAQGAQSLSAVLNDTRTGLPCLGKSAQSLSAGTAGYVAGVNALLQSNQALSRSLGGIYASTQMTAEQKVAALGEALAALNTEENQQQMTALANGGEPLVAGADALAAALDTENEASAVGQLLKSLNDLNAGLQRLNAGGAELAAGTQSLAESAGQLKELADGVDQLTAALEQLDGGAAQLEDGSAALAKGVSDAQSGGGALSDGAAKLAAAAGRLQSGAAALAQGASDAKSGVDTALADAKDGVSALDGIDGYAKDPVDIEETPVNPVPNYGTAFAPYFMSLSLYVGALIMFVGTYLDVNEKIKLLSHNSEHRFLRVGLFALIGGAQAVLLALLVKYGLGLTIVDNTAYYLSCILVSMVFTSIVEFFFVYLKDVGKFLSMLLLILQLTSCGGTFPMETVPKFFRVLYPYMPMTYSVQLFKEAISGYDADYARRAALVLFGIFAAFTLLTILFSLGRKAKERHDGGGIGSAAPTVA